MQPNSPAADHGATSLNRASAIGDDLPAVEHHGELCDRAAHQRATQRRKPLRLERLSALREHRCKATDQSTDLEQAAQAASRRLRLHRLIMQPIDTAQINIVAAGGRQCRGTCTMRSRHSTFLPHAIQIAFSAGKPRSWRCVLTGCSCNNICISVIKRRSPPASRPRGRISSAGFSSSEARDVDGLHLQRHFAAQ